MLGLIGSSFFTYDASMDDGHFLSFATISLGIVLFFVLALGGVFIYLFLTTPKPVPVENKTESNDAINNQ
ncbi:hypothetical protein CIK05_13440 [Bdellovibrio sp. qaytius]|nr:hypothetical protein CIK05_13440 [Bdellovibrio sp. qaytius]